MDGDRLLYGRGEHIASLGQNAVVRLSSLHASDAVMK